MDLMEFNRGYTALRSFPGPKDSEPLREVWWANLRGLPGRPFLLAVNHWLEAEKFMPSIREIKALTFQYMSPQDKGEAPDVDIPVPEVEFGAEMFPILGKWMRKELNRTQYLEKMWATAHKHGVEDMINWDEFKTEGPVPWEN